MINCNEFITSYGILQRLCNLQRLFPIFPRLVVKALFLCFTRYLTLCNIYQDTSFLWPETVLVLKNTGQGKSTGKTEVATGGVL